MKKLKYTKTSLLTVSIIALFLLLVPSVFAGSFKIVINPSTTPVKPGIEQRELFGVHQLVPGPIDALIPGLLGWQYTFIEVKEKPDWATVILPEGTLFTKPDGVEYNFSVFISVNEEAPAYRDATIGLSIKTGKFLRTMFPSWFPFANEFNLDQDISIKAGYLPLLTPTTPTPKQGEPNSEIFHTITLKNSGNARSIIQFRVNRDDIPDGWSVQAPAPVYLNAGESIDAPLTVLTPREFGFIDEWASIPLNVEIMSALEGSDGRSQNYSIPTTSHCVGYFVPGVPGGGNPGIVFGGIAAIIIIVIFIIILAVKFIKGSPLIGKINFKRKKEKK